MKTYEVWHLRKWDWLKNILKLVHWHDVPFAVVIIGAKKYSNITIATLFRAPLWGIHWIFLNSGKSSNLKSVLFLPLEEVTDVPNLRNKVSDKSRKYDFWPKKKWYYKIINLKKLCFINRLCLFQKNISKFILRYYSIL